MRDGLGFFPRLEVEIEALAMHSGFKTYFAPLNNTRLMIEHVFEFHGEPVVG